MRNSYPACRKATRAYEGGKVDDPDDNGGRTAYGVTKAVYDAYRRNHNLPTRDVWLISEAEVDDIYLQQYWIPAHCDELPAGIDLMVFDAAIHSGVSQSVKWLQRALQPSYAGLIDGQYGQGTRAAVRAIKETAPIIGGLADRRMAFLKQLADWNKYKNGWTRRISAVTLTAGKLAHAQNIGPVAQSEVQPVHADATPKASITTAVPAPTTGAGDAAAGVGVAAGTFSGTLEGLRATLQPLATGNAFVTKLIIALAILGAALTIGGLAYRFYQQRRAAERRDALDINFNDQQAGLAFANMERGS